MITMALPFGTFVRGMRALLAMCAVDGTLLGDIGAVRLIGAQLWMLPFYTVLTWLLVVTLDLTCATN